MAFKKIVRALIVSLLMAALAVAMIGCDDLGAYEDTEEYYDTFGEIVLISQNPKKEKYCSVQDHFYNKESRENFLEGESGEDDRVEYSDYSYMAIPLEKEVDMDSFALFIKSLKDITVYINVFVIDELEWDAILDEIRNSEEPVVYDDATTKVGEVSVHLQNGKWSSFLLDTFSVNEIQQRSIKINKGQYILLQFKNNCGVHVLDNDKQILVDPQTGLQKAEIKMTNLLIRALDVQDESKVQGGE